MFQRGGTATAIERSANLSDEVTEGRSSDRAPIGWKRNALNEKVEFKLMFIKPTLTIYHVQNQYNVK